jgi:hypothetical protein
LKEPVAYSIKQNGLKARLEDYAFPKDSTPGKRLFTQNIGLSETRKISVD